MTRSLAVVSLLVLPLAACATDPSEPVVTGPFDGAAHRFVVDKVVLPATGTEAREVGEDLDGNGVIDNLMGSLTGTLAGFDDITTHAADMIASGVLASSIVIRSDDLANDPKAGIALIGAADDPELAFGGQFVSGRFHSNRAHSSAPGSAFLRLPVFTDADPLAIHTTTLELDLTPDGAGGYDGVVRGGLVVADVAPAIAIGIRAMMTADPNDHRSFAQVIDADMNGQFTDAEIVNNELIVALTMPDVELGGEQQMSFAYAIHLSPCTAGTCVTAPPADSCGDRIVDGDETGIDCGGSCKNRCAGDVGCAVDGDCQSSACSEDHACIASSCQDGITDGFESGPDCGGIALCARCALGVRCNVPEDCDSGKCDTSTSRCTIFPPPY